LRSRTRKRRELAATRLRQKGIDVSILGVPHEALLPRPIIRIQRRRRNFLGQTFWFAKAAARFQGVANNRLGLWHGRRRRSNNILHGEHRLVVLSDQRNEIAPLLLALNRIVRSALDGGYTG